MAPASGQIPFLSSYPCPSYFRQLPQPPRIPPRSQTASSPLQNVHTLLSSSLPASASSTDHLRLRLSSHGEPRTGGSANSSGHRTHRCRRRPAQRCIAALRRWFTSPRLCHTRLSRGCVNYFNRCYTYAGFYSCFLLVHTQTTSRRRPAGPPMAPSGPRRRMRTRYRKAEPSLPNHVCTPSSIPRFCLHINHTASTEDLGLQTPTSAPQDPKADATDPDPDAPKVKDDVGEGDKAGEGTSSAIIIPYLCPSRPQRQRHRTHLQHLPPTRWS